MACCQVGAHVGIASCWSDLCCRNVQQVHQCVYVYMCGCAGPRRTGEGTEDEEQGIIAAESTATG